MKIIKLISLLLFAVVIMTGCKPTEKNYRQAYEAAKQKREAANAEAMIPATGVMTDEGVTRKVVDGDTLFVTRDRLSRTGESADKIRPYNVAVGVYKMNTNAKAQAKDLTEKGYDAYAVETTGNRWFAIAGSFDTLSEARVFINDFKKKNPGYPYIGLPGAPVIAGK
ncbi:MAG: SPOR domain-containing protein [Muribaculaceae bacterium]|nr:SPOR domain-containing protein [Muribaculaceae bacterium]